MVTRSIDNYEQHKKDVFNIIESNYGKERATKFIEFYSSRYDKFQRSFLDYRLAFWLMDDWSYVNRIGTKWYGFVGTGGTGKTTLAKNVFHFLDPTLTPDRANVTMEDFLKSLDEFETTNSMKGLFLDEPDEDAHNNSKLGKKIREVFGKARQQKLFLGICATTLTDIPPYIFKKLDGIFFLPLLKKGMFFKNRPRHYSYPIQTIRQDYSKKGYSIFFELSKTQGCLNFDTQAATPLSFEQEEQYLTMKRQDYKNTIREARDYFTKTSTNNKISFDRDKVVAKLIEKGMTQTEVANIMEVSQQRVAQIIPRASKSLEK